jgi:hypothetical protein
MRRQAEPHRPLGAILVLDDASNIVQRHPVDIDGHLRHPIGRCKVAAPLHPVQPKVHTEIQPPPVPIIHGAHPPVHLIPTPAELDPCLAPTFTYNVIFSSREAIESDFCELPTDQ